MPDQEERSTTEKLEIQHRSENPYFFAWAKITRENGTDKDQVQLRYRPGEHNRNKDWVLTWDEAITLGPLINEAIEAVMHAGGKWVRLSS